MTTLAVLAQNTIKGVVKDANNSETLPGASIAVAGTTQGTITNVDGSFTLSLPTGSAKLVLSFVGYITTEKEINVVAGENDLGSITLEPSTIGLNEMLVVASFARDRQTPVSVSRIEPKMIEEKLGTKEFVEILKSTPSVYATKAGGGYGDSRINLRGFASDNIGVLINGVPVNDMENGAVYWSNWAGLSDVTQTMQVQRGLGASKIAISSVGGTINIITKSTDAQKGGAVFYNIGNDNTVKTGFSLSTGLLENGWAVSTSGARSSSNGYIPGTNYEGWSYFLNIAKRITTKQQLSFTAFGSQQWHNQRYYKHLVQEYRDSPYGRKLNTDYGYLDGNLYSVQYNEYSKPQMSVNHTWQLSEKSTLSTSAYASFGRGGGRRIRGTNANWIQFNSDGTPTPITIQTSTGHLDLETATARNKAAISGSEATAQMEINSHNWYGVLSSLNTTIGKLNITAGIDGRYYKGFHTTKLTDLLGGKYYLDVTPNVNRPSNTPLYVGDNVNRDYVGEVTWGGLFGQGEYVADHYSAFASLAVSNTSYQRYDYFFYTPEQGQKSAKKNFQGYSAKGGFNYNINKYNNLFFNTGYFVRAPFFKFVFNKSGSSGNYVNEGVKHEKVMSFETGYGFRSSFLSGDITLYRTEWRDKALTRTVGNDFANITGLNAIHQGVEITVNGKSMPKLDLSLMVSIGDWKWANNVVADIFDANNTFVRTDAVYAKGIHVGDAAQTTAAFTVNYEILPKLKIGVDYSYAANLYAYFDINSRLSPKDEGVDAWKLPSYHLFDLNIRYAFKVGKMDATMTANIDNIFDTEYIADANDGTTHDVFTSPVYYGFGRTWSLGFKVRF